MNRSAISKIGAISALVLFGAAVALGHGSSNNRGVDGFRMLTAELSRDEKMLMCGIAAETMSVSAAETADPTLRTERFNEAWRFQRRMAPLVARAKDNIGTNSIAAARDKAGQAIGMMSYGLIEVEVPDDPDDLMFAFTSAILRGCMGWREVASSTQPEGSAPEASELGYARFRYNAKTGSQLFSRTGAEELADMLCAPSDKQTFDSLDFAGVSLEVTGEYDWALIDFAVKCENLAGVRWLLQSGALPGPAIGNNYPPVVEAAKIRDPAILRLLLDYGADPNAVGVGWPAIETAWLEGNRWNDHTNFEILVAAGADLGRNFETHTMWFRWASERRWDMIEEHFVSFEGDPVDFGSWIEFNAIEPEAISKQNAAMNRVKQQLGERGVCFPVGDLGDLERDERGFYIQPDCPKKN